VCCVSTSFFEEFLGRPGVPKIGRTPPAPSGANAPSRARVCRREGRLELPRSCGQWRHPTAHGAMRPVGSLFILNHPVDQQIQSNQGADGVRDCGAQIGNVLGFRGDGFPLNSSGLLGGFRFHKNIVFIVGGVGHLEG